MGPHPYLFVFILFLTSLGAQRASAAKVLASDEAMVRLGPRIYFKSDMREFVSYVTKMNCLIEDNFIKRLVELNAWENRRRRAISKVGKKKRKEMYHKVFTILQANQCAKGVFLHLS